jgi:hypothetical protein
MGSCGCGIGGSRRGNYCGRRRGRNRHGRSRSSHRKFSNTANNQHTGVGHCFVYLFVDARHCFVCLFIDAGHGFICIFIVFFYSGSSQ